MENPGRFRQTIRALALMSTISSYLLGSILVGIFGGKWLDNYFQTRSVFLISGLLIGIAIGVSGVIIAVKHFLEDENAS